MTKPINKPKTPASQDAAIVLFGSIKMLPKELEEMGLADKIEVQEIPGVSPTWKPEKVGDFMIGKCVDMREMEMPDTFHKGETRQATVLVFNTAVPGGFRSIWLGADLRIKLRNPLHRVFSIYYDGRTPMKDRQPMETYRVYEILPLLEEGSAPDDNPTIG